MRLAFLLSVKVHSSWLGEFFFPRKENSAPLTARRLFLFILLFPAYIAIQLSHWIGFVLDEVFYQDYKSIKVRSPLFVTGIPRSGTTFVHRVISSDEDMFTTMSSWEVFCAPSITQKQFGIEILSFIERLNIRSNNFLLNWIRSRMSDFESIHPVGLKEPEEDYLTLLPFGGCFMSFLFSPGSEKVWELTDFQKMEALRRNMLLLAYKANIQRHLYAFGMNKTFIAKNASFGTWSEAISNVFPDGKFCFCLRKPETALASQISSIHQGVKLAGLDSIWPALALQFQAMYLRSFESIGQFVSAHSKNRFGVVLQESLKENSEEIIHILMNQLQLPFTSNMIQSIKDQTQHSHSTGPHKYQSPNNILWDDSVFESLAQCHKYLSTYDLNNEPN